MRPRGRREAPLLMTARANKHPLPNWARWGYGLGTSALLLGLLLFLTSIFLAARAGLRGVHRLTIPGETSLNIRWAGRYLGVYTGGQTLLPHELSSLRAGLYNSVTELPIPVYPASASLRMGARNRGFAFLEFEVLEEGPYRLVLEIPGMNPGEAEGMLLHFKTLSTRAELGVGLFLFLLLGGIGVYTLFRTRRKVKNARAKGTEAA